jgi:hypothetical protein
MSMKNVILKPSKKLILPEEIPVGEAIRLGLATPPRRVGKIRIPAIPAGMGVFAKFGVQVLDKAGKAVAFRHPKTGKMVKKLEGPSHSFTRAMGFFVRGFMQNLDSAINLNETLTADTGATFLVRLKSSGTMTGAISIVTGAAKIKFGNSAAALASTQTNLQGLLLGLVTEAAVTTTLVVEDTTNTIFTVVGQITNTTGGSFTVEEMGLFPELNSTAGVGSNTTMFLRDLTGPVVVADTQTIVGTYTFTIAV